MDGIDGVSGIAAVPGDAVSAYALPLRSIARGSAVAPAGQTAAAETSGLAPSESSAGQVRSSQIGGDGRFEKLILAIQALRFVYSVDEPPTARTREMREAAEEIFRIDGVPQPVRPAAEVTDAAPLVEPTTADEAAPQATPQAAPGAEAAPGAIRSDPTQSAAEASLAATAPARPPES